MTSKLTRERLQEIAEDGFLKHGESKALARMALAAMDSEPVAWTWHYREQWHVTNDERRAEFVAKDGDVAVLPLYRHAQPVPVVSADLLHTAASAIEDLLTTKDRTGACVWFDLPFRLRSAANAQPALVVPDEIKHRIGGLDWGWEGEFNRGWNACRAAMLQAEPVCTCPSGDGSLRWPCPVHPGSSPVIPDGYVMVPMRLTAENGAKGALSGEFSETKFVNCPECFGDDECETCDGSGRIEITVPVTWTTIKEIWAKGVEHFAAAPQSPGGDHATVPGKWIPVSERLPEDSGRYWCYVEEQNDLGKSHYQWNCSWNGDRWWVESEGGGIVTHWMPLPAAPQEVNRE
ncbi:DUF551 domain-containing protein [Klebsiella pneumoniae]|nr:DUF551 domain-containing protein [Klebsiella pneumoniae]MCY4777811.1 DUF551 domain-containing protein [Klebsiella pneumoniae]MDG0038206.1 DUF551 domain-containing protein [Klebsiella pneumoniae]